MRGHLVRIAGDAGDDHVADGQALLETPALEVFHLVLLFLQTAAAAELLHASDVDGVNLGAIVGKEGSEGPSDDLTAVDDCDATAEEALAVVQEGVVDAQVLEDLDAGEGSAGQNALLRVVRRVEEADVLVHVADELWRQALDVLVHADRPLQGAVALRVEDRVVDDDAVDGVVGVGVTQLVLEVFPFHLAEGEVESIVAAGLARPFRVHARRRVFVGQEAVQVRFSVEGCQTALHLGRKRFGDRCGQDDFT